MNNYSPELATIDQTFLTPLVRQALHSDTVTVTTWAYQPIYGGLGMFADIYRFTGSGWDNGQTVSWSLILKVSDAARGSVDPASTQYWQREALAYQSGFLEQLAAGLRAPRCFSVHQPSAGKGWLWLEELTDGYDGQWPLARYGLAARHLGQFNGAYLTHAPLPTDKWLSRGWLRAWLAQAVSGMNQLVSAQAHPLGQRFYPPDVAAGYQRLWEEREAFLTTLDRLPQTLCHGDTGRRNLFARHCATGEEQTVAIDWSDIGIRAVGEDLVSLVLSTGLFFEVDLTTLPTLDKLVFDQYVVGLREAGWQGNPQLARLSYTLAAPLRYGVGLVGSPEQLDNESMRLYCEQAFGRSIEVIADQHAAIGRYVLQLADEARALLTALL